MVSLNNAYNSKAPSLHILHVVSGDLWAGAEAMLYTLAKSLHHDFGVYISVAILNPGRLEQDLRRAGIPVYIIDESRLNSLQILQQLNRIIVELQPDVIHTHRIKENIFGSYLAWRNGRIPSLRTLHGAQEHRPPLYQLPKLFIQFLDWLCARFYQKYIIAVSPALAQQLEKYYPKAKIKVIENGIDISSLAPTGLPRHKKTTANSYRIGIIGRLTPVKRVDLFIQCASHIKRLKPEYNINFFIYGDGPLLKQLQTQVQTEKAEDYVHFEGHCDDIAEKLTSLDALLMTSDHEGLPMVLLEAMCLNTPIIAHAVGGIPNLLDHGNCGVLVDDHQADAFARAVITLIEQPELHQQLAQHAFQRVNEFYSARQTAHAYLETYREILAR